MLLWRAKIAQARLESKVKQKDKDFYRGQIQSASFFIGGILPITVGKIRSILNFGGSVIDIDDAAFGGH